MAGHQIKLILRRLQQGDRLTSFEAQEMGIARLASRITDLRKLGYVIESRFVKIEKGDGSKGHVKQYWLKKSPQKTGGQVGDAQQQQPTLWNEPKQNAQAGGF